MRRQRTTHSDLAEILETHAAKLAAIPTGYMVSDASTLRCITDAARILCEQDARIDELTMALREHGGKDARKYLRHRDA